MLTEARSDRILWLLLLLSAGLRFWKINGDLPYVFHYDEPTLVDNGVWLWQQRTLDPHFFNYPTGLIYLLALLFGFVLMGGIVIGRFADMHAALAWLGQGTYTRPPEGGVLYFYPTLGVSALYLIGRSVSALAGVMCVALIYEVARACGGSRGLARMAALFLAVSPLAVEHSHLITMDSTATALATGALLAVIHAETGGTRRWIFAGVMAGLAAGVKYNAGLVVMTLLLLAVWRMREDRRAHGLPPLARRPDALRPLAIAAASALASFLVTTPFAILDFPRFARDLGYEFHRVARVTASFQGQEAVEATAIEKVADILMSDLGIFGIVAAIWGGIIAVRTRRFAMIAVVVWVAAALLPQLRWRSLYARYLLPPWPAILLLAANGVWHAGGHLAARLRRGPPGLATTALVLLVLAPGTQRLVLREARRAEPDPRIEMTEWVERNVPEGERIAMEPGGPFPSADRYTIDRSDFIGRYTPDLYRANGIRYVIGSGREERVRGKEPYKEVFQNLDRIRAGSDIAWSRGRYVIYRLRGGADWEGPVREALAAGEPGRARAILEGNVRAGGGTPFAWKTLAGLRVQLGDTLAARAAYEEVARLSPADVEAPLALSSLAIASRDWDQALLRLADAQRLSPRDPLVFHNLAVVHLYRAQELVRGGDRTAALKEWEAARTNAETSAKFAPGDPQMTGVKDQAERMGRRWGFLR